MPTSFSNVAVRSGSYFPTSNGPFSMSNVTYRLGLTPTASLKVLSNVVNFNAALPRTLTPGGASLLYGPTAAQAVVPLYNGIRGYQVFTALQAGNYNIACCGAAGGPYSSNAGGLGGQVSATFALSNQQRLVVVVGQLGASGVVCGGGGGGSFVVDPSTSNCLVCAGGGGGSGTTSGGSATLLSSNGTAPALGGVATAYQNGAGFNVSGTVGTPGGGVGATSAANYTNGFNGGGSNNGTCGGFGGGGCPGNPSGSGAGGGGGGYIGGVGARASGGGTSYVNTTLGSAVSFAGATRSGDGTVVITAV